MHRKILIISGGSISDEFAKEWIGQHQPDFTIVADSGMEFMRRVGIKPDMIIGDFDSVKADTLDFFKKQEGIVWKELNPVKDDTDTEFAIRQAISLGAKEITVLPSRVHSFAFAYNLSSVRIFFSCKRVSFPT